MTSLRDKILAAEDLEHEDVEIPEWGGVTVRVHGLTGRDRDAYEATGFALRKGGTDVELRLQDYRARMLVKCCSDPETGERLFTDKDIAALSGKSSVALGRLFDVACRLSGMASQSLVAARGNSKAARSGSSTTD